MRKILVCSLISVLSLNSADLIAKNRKAHVHGVVSLTLAIEENKVEIELETPADSLFGFEHKAKESDERKIVIKAESVLNSPQDLFSFLGTDCKVENTNVDLSDFITDEHHHDNHKHEEESHDDHHDHDTHEDDHHDHGEKHSEVHVGYSFSCDDAKKLTSISTELLTNFPRIEKVKAMWITESGQGLENLNKNKKTISLK